MSFFISKMFQSCMMVVAQGGVPFLPPPPTDEVPPPPGLPIDVGIYVFFFVGGLIAFYYLKAVIKKQK